MNPSFTWTWTVLSCAFSACLQSATAPALSSPSETATKAVQALWPRLPHNAMTMMREAHLSVIFTAQSKQRQQDMPHHHRSHSAACTRMSKASAGWCGDSQVQCKNLIQTRHISAPVHTNMWLHGSSCVPSNMSPHGQAQWKWTTPFPLAGHPCALQHPHLDLARRQQLPR